MHVAGVARQEQDLVWIRSHTCCVRELNTGTVTDTLNTIKAKPQPHYGGIAICFSDVPTFVQPRLLLLHFLISY